MTDAATIARRLSPAQKRALLWLPGDGAWKPISGKGGPQLLTRKTLRELGIAVASHTSPLRYRLTDHIGLAVRAELERMEAGDA